MTKYLEDTLGGDAQSGITAESEKCAFSSPQLRDRKYSHVPWMLLASALSQLTQVTLKNQKIGLFWPCVSKSRCF